MKTKAEKAALKLEAARLAKAHLQAEDWTPESIDACERLANRYLGHTKGCRGKGLRTSPKVCELPSSHFDFTASSPITFIT